MRILIAVCIAGSVWVGYKWSNSRNGAGTTANKPVGTAQVVEVARKFLRKTGMGRYEDAEVKVRASSVDDNVLDICFKGPKTKVEIKVRPRPRVEVIGMLYFRPDRELPLRRCTMEEALETANTFLHNAGVSIGREPDLSWSDDVPPDVIGDPSKPMYRFTFCWTTRLHGLPVCDNSYWIDVDMATGVVHRYRIPEILDVKSLPHPPFKLNQERAVKAAQKKYPELGAELELYPCYMRKGAGPNDRAVGPTRPYWIGRKERVPEYGAAGIVGYVPGIVRVDAETGEVDEQLGGDETYYEVAKRVALEKEKGK